MKRNLFHSDHATEPKCEHAFFEDREKERKGGKRKESGRIRGSYLKNFKEAAPFDSTISRSTLVREDPARLIKP